MEEVSLDNLSGTIMLKGEPLVHISFKDDVMQDLTFYTDDENKLPIYFKLMGRTEDAVRAFFEDRITPPTRQHLYEDMIAVGIERYSIEALTRVSNGKACSDPYDMTFD